MTDIDIHTRLNILGDKLEQAQHRIKLRSMNNQDHESTMLPLRERYRYLLELVNTDLKTAEAQGPHVGDLEKSVMLWYEGLDN